MTKEKRVNIDLDVFNLMQPIEPNNGDGCVYYRTHRLDDEKVESSFHYVGNQDEMLDVFISMLGHAESLQAPMMCAVLNLLHEYYHGNKKEEAIEYFLNIVKNDIYE